MLPKTLTVDMDFRKGIYREERDLLKEGVHVLDCARNNRFVQCK